MSFALRLIFAGVALSLASCAVGPDYVRPTLDVPEAYKESANWKTAEPRTVDGRERWWTWYGDPSLDALVAAANGANQTISQAEAQYRQRWRSSMPRALATGPSRAPTRRRAAVSRRRPAS